LEKHCVSLEVAKKLKEAGWTKETKFYWKEFQVTKGTDFYNPHIVERHYQDLFLERNKRDCKEWLDAEYPNKYFSAPLATEILEDIFKVVSRLGSSNNCVWDDSAIPVFSCDFKSNNYINALGECWLYLKTNNLLGE